MITAKIIAQTHNKYLGTTLTTYELEYPRFIHAELMTHRVFSRNSASSRAIPVKAMLENIRQNLAMPVHWGKNQAGMQAKEELDPVTKVGAKVHWNKSADAALFYAESLNELGTHKQIVNRITEPYQHMKVVVSATEWNNWFALRNHPDAQPEIQELAAKMVDIHFNFDYNEDTYHIPYVTVTRDNRFFDENDNQISLEDALKISASCCAQVSYRKNDPSLEKADMVFDRLINSKPVHASPVEHQAFPMIPVNYIDNPLDWFDIEGVTHIDKYGQPWSGNFCGFSQYRQMIDGNVVEG